MSAACSVNVALITLVLAQSHQVLASCICIKSALLFDQGKQDFLHVFSHVFGIAAYIDMGAVLQPCKYVGCMLLQQVLHMDSFWLVTREGDIKSCQQTALLPGGEFTTVEKIFVAVAVAAEQPVATNSAGGLSFLQERAEWCDAGAGADLPANGSWHCC